MPLCRGHVERHGERAHGPLVSPFNFWYANFFFFKAPDTQGVREVWTSKASLLPFAEVRRLVCMVNRKEKWKMTGKDRSK